MRSAFAKPDYVPSDQEFRASMVGAATVTFTDDGDAEVGMDPPLPPLRKVGGEWRFINLAVPSRDPLPRPGLQFPER